MTQTPAGLAVVFDKGAATAGEIGVGLGKLGPPVIVLGPSAYATTMRPLLEQFGPVVDLADGYEQVEKALAAAGTRGIVTFSESMQRVTARLAEGLGLPYHSPTTVELLTDKFGQRERLRRNGVTKVRSVRLRHPDQWAGAVVHTGLPAVVKPAHGEGSRNTYRVDEAAAGAELVSHLLATGEEALVVEEFLRGRPETGIGDYVSVECAVVDGRVWPFAVTGRLPQLPPFRETGQFWPARLEPEERRAVVELAARAVRALGVTIGLTHVEVKLTNGGPEIIEVNGRLGGHQPELAMRAARLDVVELAGRIALRRVDRVDPVTLDRVYFQYVSPTPRVAGRLVRVQGIREVRATPGITDLRRVVQNGETIDGGVGTAHLDLICGQADTHDEMIATLDRALAHLRYTFTTADGSVEFSALELRA